MDDAALAFFGWYKVRENDEFEIYAKAYGDAEQVISKDGRRFLLVDDFNDAQQMKGERVIKAPEPPASH